MASGPAAEGSRMTGADGNAADYFIERHLREGRGERLAFADPWRRLTYAELSAASARFAAGIGFHPICLDDRLQTLRLGHHSPLPWQRCHVDCCERAQDGDKKKPQTRIWLFVAFGGHAGFRRLRHHLRAPLPS